MSDSTTSPGDSAANRTSLPAKAPCKAELPGPDYPLPPDPQPPFSSDLGAPPPSMGGPETLAGSPPDSTAPGAAGGPTDLAAGPTPGALPGPPNESGPYQELIISVSYSPHIAVSDGKSYDRCMHLNVTWKLAPNIEKPHHYNVYRDGKFIKQVTIRQYVDLSGLPATHYHYVIKAATAADVEYATGHHLAKTPDTRNNYKAFTKIAVVPLRMKNCEVAMPSKSDMHYTMVTAQDSMLNYFKENSYGKVDFTVQYYDEMELPKNVYGYCSVVNDETQTGTKCSVYEDVEALLVPLNIMDNFDFILLPTAGYAEGGDYKGKLVMYDCRNHIGDAMHEMMHSRGGYHAGDWNCGNNLVGPTLENLTANGNSISRYGDSFDILGGSEPPFRHMGAVHKLSAGFLTWDNVTTVTTENTYPLHASELPGNNIKMLRVPFPGVNDKVFYALEYTSGNGYFNSQPIPAHMAVTLGNWQLTDNVPIGVMIRLRHDQASFGQPTTLDTDTFLIRTLITPDKPFYDSARDILIEVESYGNNVAYVKISGNLAG